MFLKHKKINSLDDGNCAYNASILALGNLLFGGILDERGQSGDYEFFIEKCHQQLGIEKSWSGLKKFFEEHKTQPITVQKSLAPILRSMVGDRIKENLQQQNFLVVPDSEIEGFQAEFRDFLFKTMNLQRDEKFKGGDIFSRHAILNSKFSDYAKLISNELSELPHFNLKDFKDANLLLSQKKELTVEQKLANVHFEEICTKHTKKLVTWFENEGYAEFLKQMNRDRVWAGGRELATIAQYFKIDFKAWNREDYSYSIYSNHGLLPTEGFTPKDIALLVQRGIIDKELEEGKLKFLELTESELTQRLDTVPSSSLVFDDWYSKIDLEKKPVAPEITQSLSLLAILMDRGIVTNDKETQQFLYFSDLCEVEVILEKLGKLDCAENFKTKWQSAYTQRPTIILSNPRELHWYFMQPKDMCHWNLDDYDVSYSQTQDALLDLYLSSTTSLLSNWVNLFSKNNNSMQSTNSYPFSDKPNPVITPTPPGEQKSFGSTFESEWLAKASGELNDFLAEQFKDYESSSTPVPSGKKSPAMVEEHNDFYEGCAQLDELTTPPTGGNSNSPSNISPDFTAFTSLGFFANNTKSQPNISNSPPNSDFVFPPPKRQKQIPRNVPLMHAAENACNKLQELNSDNVVIKQLIEAYSFIIAAGDIGKKDGSLLLNPKEYAKIKGLPFPSDDLPLEVTLFSQQFTCDLLFQVQKALPDPLSNLHTRLIISLKNPAARNNIIDFLNSLNETVTDTNFSLTQLRDLLVDCDLNALDNLESEFNSKDAKQNLEEMKEYLKYCNMVLDCLTPQACASSILSLMNIDYKKEFKAYEELFTSIKDNGFSKISYELEDLLNFKSDQLSSDMAVGKAIESFKQIFKHELIQLNSYLSQTLY